MKAFQFIKGKSVGEQIDEVYSATRMYIAQRVGERGFNIDFSDEPDYYTIIFEGAYCTTLCGSLKRIYRNEHGFCVSVDCDREINDISLDNDVYQESWLSIAKAIEDYNDNHKEPKTE